MLNIISKFKYAYMNFGTIKNVSNIAKCPLYLYGGRDGGDLVLQLEKLMLRDSIYLPCWQ